MRSLGQGRGSVSGWTWPTYRRLLRVVAYHQRFRRWRDLRIALWLDGLEIDLRRVRADLADLYRDMVLGANRELRTERWNARDDAPPTPGAVKAIARRFLAPDALESWIRQLDLDPIADPALRFVLSIMMTPKGQRVGVAFIHQLVATGAGDIPAAMGDLRAELPHSIAEALDGDEKEWAAHAGLLAHPDGFENPLLRGIEVATDQTLLSLRDAANETDRAWRYGMRLATTLLEVRPEILGTLRLMAPFATRLTRTMAARSPFHSTEARVMVMAYALASESILADQGQRLSVGLRIVSQLATWLAYHKELLRGAAPLQGHGRGG